MTMLRRFLPALAFFLLIAAPARAQIVEDFEGYVDTADLDTVWLYGELDTSTPNPDVGTQSLRRSGEAAPGGGYHSDGMADGPTDLSGLDIGILARRDPGSVSPTGFQIAVRDGSYIPCFGAIVAATDTAWHAVDLDMQSETCQSSGIDPTDITTVVLNIYNQSGSTGMVIGNFDDLTIFLARDDFESGNFSGWDVVEPMP